MRKTLLSTLAFSLFVAMPLLAQPPAAETDAKPAQNASPDMQVRRPYQPDFSGQAVKTFYFSHLSRPAEIQDVVNAFRTILEIQRIQSVPGQSAVVVRATNDQIARAEKLVADLDKPRAAADSEEASYRLDFALNDIENGKKVGGRSYAVVVRRGADQHNAALSKYRSGSRVPIMTGASPATQWQYNDVGVNIDCRLYGPDDALTLESSIEVSSVANPQGSTPQPVVRQTKSDSNVMLPAGKRVVLASLDAADSPRQLEIEVTATKLK